MRPILIRVSRRSPPRLWACYVGGLAVGGGWVRSVPLTALESLDEATRLRRQGHTVRRCEPWVRFDNCAAARVLRAQGGAR